MPYKWKLVLTANGCCISTHYLVDCKVKGYCRITSCLRSKHCGIISRCTDTLSMPYKWKLVLTAYSCCISTHYLVDCKVKGYCRITSCLRSKHCGIISRCTDTLSMPYKWKLVLTANGCCISTHYLVDCKVKGYCRITSGLRSKHCGIISRCTDTLSMPYKWKLVLTAYSCCISCDHLVDCEVKGYCRITCGLRSKHCGIISRCTDTLSMPYKWKLVLTANGCCISTHYLVDCE